MSCVFIYRVVGHEEANAGHSLGLCAPFRKRRTWCQARDAHMYLRQGETSESQHCTMIQGHES
ncbi:hypothetical protein BCR44DRAFT_1181578 [Catenaria anguillulae PL171]|uniref:Uncharacterized protein n=1 Tax=Catenaria anguillulae PL171 TaxID=765915 RepID=A0A1Y2HLR5_9FUNG|nr:hypothetical protein BCR44DRAFT_1181578 [Catenaria anguillulae PL171]